MIKCPMINIFLVLQLIVLIFFAQFSAAREPLQFRCMRPFSSLTRFKSSEMRVHEKCRFGSFVIVNASATSRCTRDEETAIDGPRTGITCTAHIELAFEMAPDDGHDKVLKDTYRYSLELRNGFSNVHYKGFDQNGYSVCCNLLHNATCSWKSDINVSDEPPQREPTVESCPLFESIAGETFFGGITKPLHQHTVANWTAQLTFWRKAWDGREFLGRVQVPFVLTEETISSAENSGNTTTSSTALTTPTEEEVRGGNDL